MSPGSLAYRILYLGVAFLYPAYASLKALDTPDRSDDSAWLMYWIVLATFTIFELFFDFIFAWLPFYVVLKVVFLAWCIAPVPTNGAFYLFKVFIQPFFRQYGTSIENIVTSTLHSASSLFPPYPKDS